MTVPAEPILIGGQTVYVKFFAMPRDPGEPPRIEGVLTLTGSEGVLTLDALVGPQGIPGEPAPIIRPQWGSTITEVGDLLDVATLDESDDGRAWYIDGQWHIYFNGTYHVVQGSIPGPTGATPDISVSAEGIEAESPVTYGAIEVDESGTSLAPHFHIKIPLVPGPEGPSAAIASASDFDNSNLNVGNMIAVADTDPESYHLITPDFLAPQIYTIPHNSFVNHTGSEPRFLIASLNIPAKTFDWYPDVIGHVGWQDAFLSAVAVEVEVRIGDTGGGTGETDPLCALGPYDPTWSLLDSQHIAHIVPHFSDTSNPNRALAPDTPAGLVNAGDAKTVYVFLHRIQGIGGYVYTKDGSHLRIMLIPQV